MMNRTTRLFLRRLASGSLVASVCAIGFASTVQATTLGPLVQVTGARHVAAWSVDRLTNNALLRAPKGVCGLAGSSTRWKKNAVPSLAMAVQGSLARAYAPPVHSVTFDGIVSAHVPEAPPALETTPTSPREPPSDQRSC